MVVFEFQLNKVLIWILLKSLVNLLVIIHKFDDFKQLLEYFKIIILNDKIYSLLKTYNEMKILFDSFILWIL